MNVTDCTVVLLQYCRQQESTLHPEATNTATTQPNPLSVSTFPLPFFHSPTYPPLSAPHLQEFLSANATNLLSSQVTRSSILL